LAKASPARSGDYLAGLGAGSYEERMAARLVLAALPLKTFLDEALIPYEADEVTRLIVDRHDAAAFAPVSHLTVGEFRNWLLLDSTDSTALAALAPGLTPEMVAAVSKLMRNQDLILAAKKCRVTTAFRNTIGLPETPDEMWNKLRPAITDPARQRKTDPGTPENCKTVFELHKAFSPAETVQEVDENCRGAKWGCIDCKKVLHANMVAELTPIRTKAEALMADPKQVDALLAEGGRKARAVAQETIRTVKDKMGLDARG